MTEYGLVGTILKLRSGYWLIMDATYETLHITKWVNDVFIALQSRFVNAKHIYFMCSDSKWLFHSHQSNTNCGSVCVSPKNSSLCNNENLNCIYIHPNMSNGWQFYQQNFETSQVSRNFLLLRIYKKHTAITRCMYVCDLNLYRDQSVSSPLTFYPWLISSWMGRIKNKTLD